MATRTRTRVWILAGVLAACGGSKPPPPVIETQAADVGEPEPKPPEPDSDTKPKEVPEVVGKPVGEPGGPTPIGGGESTSVAGGPEITVLDAGKEPRKELRHKFKKGARQKLFMQSKTKVSGTPMPLPTLGMDAPIEAKITEVNAAGEAKFSFTAGPFKTSGAGGGGGGALGAMLGAAAPSKVAGWGWITAQGVVKEQHVTEGGQEDTQLETGDPFPADAIGVGARWEVKSTLTEKGKQYVQTSTYDLVKLTGTSVSTKVRRLQEPLGTSGDPIAESSGELVYKLGQVYPTGRLSMTRDVDIALPGAENLGIKMSSDVTIKNR